MKVFIILTIIAFISCQINYKQLYHSSSACLNGRLQSPINLTETDSNFNSTINILYDTYNALKNVQLRFDERTLFINNENIEESLGYVTFSRNGALKKYALKRIEFIYPGEHKINNVASDLEIKFIHEQVIFFETDVNQFRKLVDSNTNLIISIMYRTNSLISDNGFLSELLATANGNHKTELDIDSYGLIRDRQFYFYEGSFSYNPCNENVNHIVINKPFLIKPEEKTQIDTLFRSKYVNANTAKEVAPLMGRKVMRNYALAHELSSGYLKSIAFLLIFLIFI